MKRLLPALLAVIISVGCTKYPIKKNLNTATSGNPIVITVVADNYSDEDEFDNDATNFINNRLLAHPYYALHLNQLQIDSLYQPLGSGATSNFGFDVESSMGNCALSWTVSTDSSDTATRIEQMVGGLNPRHTIVIGDHPYNTGCTEGDWTYVARGAVVGDVISHELGHGIGLLYDEFALGQNLGLPPQPSLTSDPTLDRNCDDNSDGMAPYWTLATTAFPGAAAYPECALFGQGVVHGYDHTALHDGHKFCLMGATHGADFCYICRYYMDREFGYVQNPDTENPNIPFPGIEGLETVPSLPSPLPGPRRQNISPPPNQPANPTIKPVPPRPPSRRDVALASFEQPGRGPTAIMKPIPEKPIVRVLINFDPETGAIVAKKATPITARYTPSRRRISDYVYQVEVSGTTKEVGVFNANEFRSHNYQGNLGHQTSAPHATDLTIQLPDVTRKMIEDQVVTIQVFRLLPTVTEKVITTDVVDKYKNDSSRMLKRGTITPAQLKKAL